MNDSNTNPNGIPWLFRFTKGYRGWYVLSILLAVSGVGFLVAVYVVMADVITHLVSQVRVGAWYLNRSLVIAACWVARYLLHAGSTAISHGATFKVLASIRKGILEKLSRLPLGAVQENPSGAYKNTICERVDSIEVTLAHMLPEFTANICGAIAFFVYLMHVDWRVGLWSLVTVPVGLAFFTVMMMKYPKYYPQTIEKTKTLNSTAVEYINGIEVIKAFGQSGSSYEKFVRAAKEGADCFIDWMRACTVEQSFGMAFFPATLIGILPAGAFYCMDGSLTAADFIFCIILSFGIVTPLLTVFSYTDDLATIPVIMGEVADIMDQEDLVRPQKAEALPADSSVELVNVRFAYKEEEVLHGISLRAESGTVNALVGPSGSGKSTIARLIASLWDVKNGAVRIGGVDIRKLPIEDYNRYIAYVSQENYLFNLSVMDNIRLGRPDATDEEVMDAAKRCGCHEFILHLENGYQTMCGGSGSHLSGGERQRISIARAMLKDAPIVILDEATSYTDPESEAVIQHSLAKLMQGKTVIVIAHRLSTISDADRIFVVKDGTILASGKQEELLSSCELYREMWKAHIAVHDKDEEVSA